MKILIEYDVHYLLGCLFKEHITSLIHPNTETFFEMMFVSTLDTLCLLQVEQQSNYIEIYECYDKNTIQNIIIDNTNDVDYRYLSRTLAISERIISVRYVSYNLFEVTYE